VATDAELLDDGAEWQEGEFGLFWGRHGAGVYVQDGGEFTIERLSRSI
jgi:hypothetical protein